MRVLVDTSVWIGHLRFRDERLEALLADGRVLAHDHVIGELALGSIRSRREVLDSLADLPRAPLASEGEVIGLIERTQIVARGIGYTDAHLLASVLLVDGAGLWTHDRRLAAIAREWRVNAHAV